MTPKRILSFLVALNLTSFFYLIVAKGILFSTFSFASETLQEKENRDALFFFVALIVVLATIIIIVRLIKAGLKYSAYGMVLPILIGFYVSFKLGEIYVGNLSNVESFSRHKWVQEENKPFKMARTLVVNDELIGLTQQNLVQKLGMGKETLRRDNSVLLEYDTDRNWTLRVEVINGIVVNAVLWQEGLDL